MGDTWISHQTFKLRKDILCLLAASLDANKFSWIRPGYWKNTHDHTYYYLTQPWGVPLLLLSTLDCSFLSLLPSAWSCHCQPFSSYLSFRQHLADQHRRHHHHHFHHQTFRLVPPPHHPHLAPDPHFRRPRDQTPVHLLHLPPRPLDPFCFSCPPGV